MTTEEQEDEMLKEIWVEKMSSSYRVVTEVEFIGQELTPYVRRDIAATQQPEVVDEMTVARAVVSAMRESKNPNDLAKKLMQFITSFPNGVKVEG